jgi:hypothetical protein
MKLIKSWHRLNLEAEKGAQEIRASIPQQSLVPNLLVRGETNGQQILTKDVLIKKLECELLGIIVWGTFFYGALGKTILGFI